MQTSGVIMPRLLALLAVCFTSMSAALGVATARASSPLSCDAVRPYFEAQGFQATDIPKEPISSKELKTCGGISSGGLVCCTADMEIRLQTRAWEKHDKATKDTLQRLQNILHTRAIKFHDFFNNLLKTSKKSFHEMFKKTYGILYEQNANVFIDLFQELETYYEKGEVNLDDVMDNFFNTLYQKMFTVLNSQYKFDNKYLDCVGQHMKEMRPFGDVPQKLGVQIKRSFIATRAFSQALQVAAEVLKKMQRLKASTECAAALMRMTSCPSCSGIPGKVLACNDMCENVMKGCLAQHAALDQDWNHFVEAVDKVAERLLGPFNIEMLVRPINLKISEAIMIYQESSNDVSQRIFASCGRPVLGRRRRRSAVLDDEEFDKQKFLSLEKELKEDEDEEEEEEDEDDDEERHSSAAILDKLVKEIKQRIRDSRQFWLYLPYKLCNDGLVVLPSNTHDCWNGTHIDKYIYPLAANGESQSLNPEVRLSGPRTAIVKEQIFALGSISNRLRSAYNGHDVDWIDTEDSWSSGSGSGSGSSDPITDDEDGLVEEGSGYEATVGPSVVPEKVPVKPKEHEEDSIQPPTHVEITEDDHNHDVGINTIPDTGHHTTNHTTVVKPSAGTATTFRQMSFLSSSNLYLCLVVVIWISDYYLTE